VLSSLESPFRRSRFEFGLPAAPPISLYAADHDAYVASLNELVRSSVAEVQDALLSQHQEGRWSDFLNALRAGVPSVLEYELEFAAGEQDEEDDFAGDSYEGYDGY
jgi:hypothetical protein